MSLSVPARQEGGGALISTTFAFNADCTWQAWQVLVIGLIRYVMSHRSASIFDALDARRSRGVRDQRT
jgi:hypothetical protein